MKGIRILWTDDEIEILKPHIIFLEEKGYEIITASNADDALEIIQNEPLDLIFLDEHMPGRGGLDILPEIKAILPGIPVVMITKSEEENIMDQAIGSQIDDYLIKPVNPKQILLSLKKHLEQKELVSQKTIADYQSQFGILSQSINSASTDEEWRAIYKKLVFWELEIEKTELEGFDEILGMQKAEANQGFSKFVARNYENWIQDPDPDPLMSHHLIREIVVPRIDRGEEVVVLMIDNLRYDQWRAIYPYIQEVYRIEKETLYYSILPTATQYSRNAFFAGKMPAEIQSKYPDWWIYDDEEEGKNQFESELLGKQLEDLNRSIPYYYEKVTGQTDQKLISRLGQNLKIPLCVLVFNFVDMLSHARTDSAMLKELAGDEKAYRSLTTSWFRHSFLIELIRELARKNKTIAITTDHGSTLVQNPIKIVGDRRTSTNIRYKTGKSLDYEPKEVFEIKTPEQFGLPRSHISSKYIFAKSADFMVFPKNYHHFVNYYKDTFQHGGISMQEMLIPFAILKPKT